MKLILILLVVGSGCGTRRAVDGANFAEAWLRSSIDGNTVGHSVYRYNRTSDGYRFENSVLMRLTMGGTPQRVESRSEVLAAPDLTMRSFSFSFGTASRSFSVRGSVAGGKLTIHGQAGGDATRVIDLSTGVYPLSALGLLVTSRGGQAGDSVYRLPVFDVTVLDVVPVVLRYLGREKIVVDGKEYNAHKASMTMGKLEMVTWFGEDGLPLIEEAPPAMRSERVEVARIASEAASDALVDILSMFRVRIDTVIPDGVFVHRMRVRLDGVDTVAVKLNWETQKVVSHDPLTVDIAVPKVTDAALGLPVTAETSFLRPSLTIQSDAPAIRAKAKEVAGDNRDAVAVARKLVSWTFAALDKEPTASYPTALDVLKNMKGDCNEHAVLLAALARAAGIPAKIAVGLVHLNGAFYYHAWNEFYLNGWVPVDATFGEFPASALHLKLAEGELGQQTDVLGVVGRIGIRVLEYSMRKE